MKKENVVPARIIDMYAYKIIGGFLEPKMVKTYLKLQLPINKEGKTEIIEVNVDIPTVDIQSKRIMTGKKILIERTSRDSLVYLGPEGDWETMMKFGIAPKDKAIFNVQFADFSETSPSGIEYEETGSLWNCNRKLRIFAGEITLATADIRKDGFRNCKYINDFAKKLLIDYARPRGIHFPVEKMFSD